MTAKFLNYLKTVWIFEMIASFLLRGGGDKDIHCTFFGNVVRGKSVLFSFVVRNGFVHFVRKVFARRKLLPGKFWVFAPLAIRAPNGTKKVVFSSNMGVFQNFLRPPDMTNQDNQ